MKNSSPAHNRDWADREAERLFDFVCDALTKKEPDKAKHAIEFELSCRLRQAAQNHLMFDAVKGFK